MDWKEAYDRRQEEIRRKEAEAARREEVREARKNAAASRAWEAEQQRELAKHKNKYRCRICGKRSEGPGEGKVGTYVEDTLERLKHDQYGKRFDIPTGLHKCSKCKKWACDDHYHAGLCQHCAEKPGWSPF